MDDFTSHFRHNICYMRKEFHMTQKEMAQVLGISVSKLRRIEKGDPTVRLYDIMLHRFCDHFDISADCAVLEQLDK